MTDLHRICSSIRREIVWWDLDIPEPTDEELLEAAERFSQACHQYGTSVMEAVEAFQRLSRAVASGLSPS